MRILSILQYTFTIYIVYENTWVQVSVLLISSMTFCRFELVSSPEKWMPHAPIYLRVVWSWGSKIDGTLKTVTYHPNSVKNEHSRNFGKSHIKQGASPQTTISRVSIHQPLEPSTQTPLLSGRCSLSSKMELIWQIFIVNI